MSNPTSASTFILPDSPPAERRAGEVYAPGSNRVVCGTCGGKHRSEAMLRWCQANFADKTSPAPTPREVAIGLICCKVCGSPQRSVGWLKWHLANKCAGAPLQEVSHPTQWPARHPVHQKRGDRSNYDMEPWSHIQKTDPKKYLDVGYLSR